MADTETIKQAIAQTVVEAAKAVMVVIREDVRRQNTNPNVRRENTNSKETWTSEAARKENALL